MATPCGYLPFTIGEFYRCICQCFPNYSLLSSYIYKQRRRLHLSHLTTAFKTSPITPPELRNVTWKDTCQINHMDRIDQAYHLDQLILPWRIILSMPLLMNHLNRLLFHQSRLMHLLRAGFTHACNRPSVHNIETILIVKSVTLREHRDWGTTHCVLFLDIKLEIDTSWFCSSDSNLQCGFSHD